MAHDGSELIGKQVGHYTVERCLGVGGMGAVYRARHPQMGTVVAIKVLLPRFMADPLIARRFLDEARAANQIGHRGIVQIHDCDRQDDVGFYLVMEYLEGRTCLDRLNQEGPFSPVEAVDLLLQAAAALEASHRAGIIHRDLKPQNLFLVPNQSFRSGFQLKILDFGVAKLQGEGTLGGGNTKTGMVFGSPLYMAPEQCICAKTVDQRADIYALGAIAYRVLGGRCPFEAPSLGKLIVAHLRQQPPRLESLNPTVPLWLSRVVHRALAVDRDGRYPSMAALRAALVAAAPTLGVREPDAPPVPTPLPTFEAPVPTGDGATLELDDATLRFDPERGTVSFRGVLALARMAEYKPMREFLEGVSARVEGVLTLDLRGLSRLNSPGVTSLNLFVLVQRKRARAGLCLLGNRRHPWQVRAADNARQIWPELEVRWV